MIVREIVGDRGTVISLLQPGSSPHTYDPKPSDVITIESADCFFYIDPAFDGWAASFENENVVEVLEMVPAEMLHSFEGHAHHEGDHEPGVDPHFWTDPLTVKAILPGLADILSNVDPSGTEIYAENSRRFSEELDELNEIVTQSLEPYEGEAVILMHPSFNYYLERYGLILAGTIESVAGSEPTPSHIADLIQIIGENEVRSIFVEPQLSRSAAEMLSEETGLSVYTLDPVGGYEGRETYSDLILYNTGIFTMAFGMIE